MRETLEPIFGADVTLPTLILTLIIVLLLVVVVIWLVRRYGAGGLGATIRGRLPRLAIVDAMAIDTRRKLVLVRRDNVEHLILIGGPADLVVEPGIVRTRTVSQRNGAAATAPRPAPAAEEAPLARRAEQGRADEPIPFPPRRTERPAARREAPRNASAREPEPARQRRADAIEGPAPDPRLTAFAAATGRFVEPERAEIVVEAAMPVDEAFAPPPLPGEEPEAASLRLPEEARYQPAPDTGTDRPPPDLDLFLPPAGEDEAQPAEVAASEASLAGEPPPEDDGASASRVNELEKEMARLLGEISGRRSS